MYNFEPFPLFSTSSGRCDGRLPHTQGSLFDSVTEILTVSRKAASMLRPQAVAVFVDKSRSAAWRRIPSSYLVCEDDHALPVQGQDAMIGAVKKEGVEIHVERLFSSHSPYFAKPEFVASFLRREAAKSENRFTL